MNECQGKYNITWIIFSSSISSAMSLHYKISIVKGTGVCKVLGYLGRMFLDMCILQIDNFYMFLIILFFQEGRVLVIFNPGQ